MNQRDVLVDLKNVSFKYNDEVVLEKINLEIKRGDFVGVIGPNGSGKTTLLKLMVGVLDPTEGKVAMFGMESEKFKDRYKLGYVPQRAGLSLINFPITVYELVQLGLVGVKNGSKEAIRDALNAVSMHKHKDKLLSELSGGQQQRVFIAKALVGNPELLILDEPTVGVDKESQDDFYHLLGHLNKDRNLTLVLVSHDIDVVSKEVSSVVCINKKILGNMPASTFSKNEYIEKMYGKSLQKVVHHH